MAKVNPPRKKGKKISPGILTDPWLFTRKQFWMDMSESEFQYRVGQTQVKTGSIWPVLPLAFFLFFLIASLVKITGIDVNWFDYVGFGLSLLGTLATIVWIIKSNRNSK
jgi:hypothetical protein